jgi:hypothetical protein
MYSTVSRQRSANFDPHKKGDKRGCTLSGLFFLRYTCVQDEQKAAGQWVRSKTILVSMPRLPAIVNSGQTFEVQTIKRFGPVSAF